MKFVASVIGGTIALIVVKVAFNGTGAEGYIAFMIGAVYGVIATKGETV